MIKIGFWKKVQKEVSTINVYNSTELENKENNVVRSSKIRCFWKVFTQSSKKYLHNSTESENKEKNILQETLPVGYFKLV